MGNGGLPSKDTTKHYTVFNIVPADNFDAILVNPFNNANDIRMLPSNHE